MSKQKKAAPAPPVDPAPTAEAAEIGMAVAAPDLVAELAGEGLGTWLMLR